MGSLAEMTWQKSSVSQNKELKLSLVAGVREDCSSEWVEKSMMTTMMTTVKTRWSKSYHPAEATRSADSRRPRRVTSDHGAGNATAADAVGRGL